MRSTGATGRSARARGLIGTCSSVLLTTGRGEHQASSENRASGERGAEIANERGGYSRRLPDLVFWPVRDPRLQVAVVIAPGLSSSRRERAALQGWQHSIVAGRYAQVWYVASPAFVSHLRRAAEEIGLATPQLIVGERVMVDKLPLLALVTENVDEKSAA